MDSTTILWATALIMGVAGLLMLFIGKQRTSAEGMQTILHGNVCLIAAASYFAMAIGQGLIVLPNGPGATRAFYFARYIDWAFTTPLLLVSLGLSGMHAGKKRADLLTGVVLADLLMIATALFFGASDVPWMKWTWFIISCAAFLGVYYVLWGPQLKAVGSERDDVRSGYVRHASILTVLWFLYPVVLAVAPDGLFYVSDAVAVLSIAVLDVLSKVAYGFVTLAADKSVTDRDLRETPALPELMRQPAFAR